MIREIYLESAAAASELVGHPAVAHCWNQPSALPRLRIGAVAAHLACQLTQVPPVLDEDPPAEQPISLLEHYARSTWTDGDLDSDINTRIRQMCEHDALTGPTAVAAGGDHALNELHSRLRAESPDRIIQLPWGPWALSLDDYLTTRILEIAVHCDDLAVSVHLPSPTLPAAGLDVVLDTLCRMAARRHGPTALLRALTRAERAPATIAAL